MSLKELLPMVRQLSSSDKLKLIRILAKLYTNEDISPLEPHKVYYLSTPSPNNAARIEEPWHTNSLLVKQKNL